MVVIRLARHGAKKSPFYHINVADRRFPRDGRFIERLGYFNPVHAGSEERLVLDLERLDYWVGRGAQMSDRVASLARELRNPEAAAARHARRLSAEQAKVEASLAAEKAAIAARRAEEEAQAAAEQAAAAAEEAPAEGAAGEAGDGQDPAN
ncbi:MAG: 30S ribosomal protein S16 [Gammaproteobacteria bacterium AqS3]|nr:30S ribosomal protein S16 [Gammaproteobacteria bacterium AqS3]